MIRIVTREWPLKLLALCLAMFVWLDVSREAKYFMDLTVPLELRNLPTSLTFFDDPPGTISVRVRAPLGALERLKPGEVYAAKDMSGTNGGDTLLQLFNEDIKVPSSVEVVSITPSNLRLELQAKLRRQVPIIPEFRGQLPEGYEIRGLSVDPEEAEVEGPESAVKELVQASTEAIVLSGRTVTFSERVNVDPQAPRLRLVDSRPVKVDIVIAEKTIEKTITGVGVHLRSPEVASLIVPERVSVTISGPFTNVNRITAENLAAWVELTGPLASPGPYALAPVVEITPRELAGDVSVISVSPAEVSVRRGPGDEPAGKTPGREASVVAPAPTSVARSRPLDEPRR